MTPPLPVIERFVASYLQRQDYYRRSAEICRDQCREARVPFFFKQWGGKQKSRTGRELLGRTYDETPRRPARRTADTESVRHALAEVEAFC